MRKKSLILKKARKTYQLNRTIIALGEENTHITDAD